jgi:hypothetical protein
MKNVENSLGQIIKFFNKHGRVGKGEENCCSSKEMLEASTECKVQNVLGSMFEQLDGCFALGAKQFVLM